MKGKFEFKKGNLTLVANIEGEADEIVDVVKRMESIGLTNHSGVTDFKLNHEQAKKLTEL